MDFSITVTIAVYGLITVIYSWHQRGQFARFWQKNKKKWIMTRLLFHRRFMSKIEVWLQILIASHHFFEIALIWKKVFENCSFSWHSWNLGARQKGDFVAAELQQDIQAWLLFCVTWWRWLKHCTLSQWHVLGRARLAGQGAAACRSPRSPAW